MVKEFDPLDVTMAGESTSPTAPREPTAVAGLYAGRYQIERMVGRGGMGSVYRALDVMVGDVVALKILDATVATSGDQVEWFRREVRLARRITHPNVARTHDMGEQNGAHYITMEFVEGTTLQDLLRTREAAATEEVEGDGRRRRQALAPVRAVRIALAVCDGLAAAHAAGVVHRDLKPANVLIDLNGRVVLTDFGIARTLSDEHAGARTQGVVGTPLYMAPEQLSGLAVDQRADIYALGLMLSEMLTGELPFAGQTPIATALARLTQPPPDPRTVRPDVPEALAELVLQCLAQLPDARPASAVVVAERLRAWLVSSGEPLVGVPTVTMLAGIIGAAGAGHPGVPEQMTPTQQQPMTTGATPGGLTQGSTRGGYGTATSNSRALRPLAPVPTAERALAVLPFRYIGPPDQSYLGDALTDELIDVLSRTRGLRVLGSGATAKYRSDRDPRAVGTDLGVDAVVDATVQASAKQVRVSARLVEVASGTQLWSEKFESGLEDLFELQDRICKRIAEALRVELSTSAHSDAPAEAISLYLRGRRKLLAFQVVGTDAAIELLEQSIELAPLLQPAIACHAIACLRAWFMPSTFIEDEARRDWGQQSRESVARALAEAPEMAETHLARAMLAVQLGEWREAVKALVKALEIAPTYAHAHQYLAQLQCEAGNTKEGAERAKLAVDLEPSLSVGLFDLARLHALRGEREEADRLLLLLTDQRMRNATAQQRMRVAGWYGDMDAVREIASILPIEEADGFSNYALNYARALTGEMDKEAVDKMTKVITTSVPSPRFYTLMCQASAEIYAARGFPEDALRFFLMAADSVLIDIEWTDRCPSLKATRALPGFADGRRKVRQRVQAMWSL